jgi:hypothetical protein
MKMLTSAIIFLTFASSAFGEGPVVRRGSFEQIVDSKGVTVGFKLRDLQDNAQLQKAGVSVGDMVQEMCGVKLKGIPEYRNADGILQTSDKCIIKVIREGKTLTLSTAE